MDLPDTMPLDLNLDYRGAAQAAHRFAHAAEEAVAGRLALLGGLSGETADREQRLLHGLAWIATATEAIVQIAATHSPGMAPVDELILKVGIGEYLHQLTSGIPISQSEIIRPDELGLGEEAAICRRDPSVANLLTHGNTARTRAALIEALLQGAMPDLSAGDETLDMIRSEFARFTAKRITPNAQGWHLEDALLPQEVLDEMAALGTFGVCISPAYGGLGLGKVAMCIVTEELSRGWIAAGSIGTRSEIAGELISIAGTPEQKERWLPAIASGDVLPAAVFTEPDTGSDLARLKTRALPQSDGSWRIHGNKTWITHAARSDLMTVLARTDPDSTGHQGLSMLLLQKTRGTEAEPFPDPWLEGGDIPVLGYRGMREYELAFTGAPIDANALLGGSPGSGFRQLMETFEGARIQTAARALGVGWRAWELGMAYAQERRQFGQLLIRFPRVADKLAMMLAELVMTRALTHHAARQKDLGRRCDIEAGMAKLLAARVAWANADSALQIHGGNGYALEYEISRVLCDARVLSIFEGAAEIQAHVIARGLLAHHAGKNR